MLSVLSLELFHCLMWHGWFIRLNLPLTTVAKGGSSSYPPSVSLLPTPDAGHILWLVSRSQTLWQCSRNSQTIVRCDVQSHRQAKRASPDVTVKMAEPNCTVTSGDALLACEE